MLISKKIRLYPNLNQKYYLDRLIGSYRKVYNLSLDYKKSSYDLDKTNIGMNEISKKFHNDWLKSQEFDFLNEHNTKVLKQSMIDMIDSYQNFFKGKSNFPKFKSKHSSKQSVRFPLESISKKNNYLNKKITLNKQLQNLKFRCSDKYIKYLDKNKEKIRSATLSKSKTGIYSLSILVDGDLLKEIKKPTNQSIGIDLGIKDFVVTSNEVKYLNIKSIRSNEKILKKYQRRLSKKVNGSKNKEKLRIKFSKKYEKIKNIKEDYLHKITNQLICENQIISIENLSVKNMMKNNNLAKSIQELSLYKFKSMLKYKADWFGRILIEIDRFYPSSKKCHECGEVNNNLKLSDRTWACPSCNAILDRDINAAKNILKEGLRILNEIINNLQPKNIKNIGDLNNSLICDIRNLNKIINTLPLREIKAFGESNISLLDELGNNN